MSSLVRVSATNSSDSRVHQPLLAAKSAQDLLEAARKDEKNQKFWEAADKYQQCIKIAQAQCIEEALIDAYLGYANVLFQTNEESKALGFMEQANQLITLRAQFSQSPSFTPSFFTSEQISVNPQLNYATVTKPEDLLETRHLAWHFKQENCSSALTDQVLQALLKKIEQINEQFSKSSKGLSVIHEYLALREIDDLALHRTLTNAMLEALKLDKSSLLDVKLLEALSVLLLSRPHLTKDEQRAGDHVRVLQTLLELLETIHIDDQNSLQVQALLRTLNLLLDQMVTTGVKGLARIQIQERFLQVFERFENHPEFAWPIKYARQALAHIPNDESFFDKVTRHMSPTVAGGLYLAGGILKFVAAGITHPGSTPLAIMSAGFKPDLFLNALQSFWQEYKQIASAGRTQSWYIQLRELDGVIGVALATGRLDLIEKFIIDNTPKQGKEPYHKYFLRGLCDRLERIAYATDKLPAQENAISFLDALQKGKPTWGNHEKVKAYAQTVLNRIEKWQNFNPESMPSDEAPPAWHAYWLTAPARTLLTAALKKKERHNNIEALPAQMEDIKLTQAKLAQSIQSSFAQTTRRVKQGNVQLQGLEAEVARLSEKINQLNTKAVKTNEQSLGSIREGIQALRNDYRDSLKIDGIKDALKHYVAPEAQASAFTTERFDLLAKVREFFQSDKKVLLLLGEAGSGKSTFMRHLAIASWKAYGRDKSKPIPLFIRLAECPSFDGDLIAQYLQKHGFSETDIEVLRKNQKFIFILDGFDEIEDRNQAFSTKNQLPLWKKSKLIISSRREYLGPRYHSQFQARDQKNTVQEYWLAPISDNWIKNYIEKYVESTNSAAQGWNTTRYLTTLDKFPSLKEVIRRPFLLRMALEVLPSLKGQEGITDIKQTTLFDKFIECWLERAQERLQHINLSSEEKEALNKLGKNLEAGILRAIQEMAVSLTKARTTQAVHHEEGLVTPAEWEPYLKGDAHKRLLFLNAPLIRQGQQYRFVHKSLQEYLVARAIWSQSKSLPLKKQIEQGQALLSQFVLTNEPAILAFLIEYTQRDDNFAKYLREWIEASKASDATNELKQAAANTMTILVQSGKDFNGEDLAKIKIPGADISSGKFDHAILKEADLEGVIARQVWLRNADLSQANLLDINFGEMPNIGEEKAVRAVKYSHDSTLLAAGLLEGPIDIYQVATGRKILTLKDKVERSLAFAFSYDKKRLISGGSDKKVCIWDLEKGILTDTFEGHQGRVISINFSPDEKYIVSGSEDCTVRVWDIAENRLIHTLVNHTDDTTSAKFSADGKYIVSGSFDNTVCIWEAYSGKLLSTKKGANNGVECLDISADGERIVSGDYDGTVWILSTNEDKPIHILKDHTYPIHGISFIDNDDLIVSIDKLGIAKVWDAHNGYLLDSILRNYADMNFTALSQDAQLAASIADHKVRLWEVDTSRPSQRLIEKHSYVPFTVGAAFRSSIVVSADEDGKLCIWDAKTAQLQRTAKHELLPDTLVLSMCLSPDGEHMVSADTGGTLMLWNTLTGERLWQWRNDEHNSVSIWDVEFSADSRHIISGSEDGRIRVWDRVKEKLIWISPKQEKGNDIYRAKFSANGKRIVSVGKNRKLYIWDLEKGMPISISARQDEDYEIFGVDFSSDGRRVVSGGSDGKIRIWDISTITEPRILKGHGLPINDVRFSPDEKFIASASHDQTVQVWDVHSGARLMVIKGGGHKIGSVVWQQPAYGEGYALVTYEDTNAINLWHLPKIQKGEEARLVWSIGVSSLVLDDVNCEKVQGLIGEKGERNARLLKQRGGINVPKPKLKEGGSYNLFKRYNLFS